MTFRFFTLKPDITVFDALLLMHREHVCNLPVVDDQNEFKGLSALSRPLYQCDACDRG
jgi:CBS domain-containing protein